MILSKHCFLLSIIAVFAMILGIVFALPDSVKKVTRVTLKNVLLLAEVVDYPETRERGLSGRKDMPLNHAMLFLFEKPDYYGIWMKDMHFPIDIFWIKNGVVVDLEENIQPSYPLYIYKPDVPAEMVLETRAGLAKANGITIGDTARIFFNESGAISTASATVYQANNLESPVGSEYFIENLRRKETNGKNLRIEKLLAESDNYKKFLIYYNSGALTISGTMNVPKGEVPPTGFPVLILNHGLISPKIYFSGRGSRREQDFFARNGYITIHSDYRGLGYSSPNPNQHHDFYQGYTEDVINLVDAIKRANPKLFDAKRMGIWGHSMGGGIAARVMALRLDLRAYVLFAPISAETEDNFYELPKSEIKWLAEKYGIGETASALYKKMSPLTYFSGVEAPVQLHHGTQDKDVPISFSYKMFTALKNNNKKVELYTYGGEGHEFADAWQIAASRALNFFDKYVKGAR